MRVRKALGDTYRYAKEIAQTPEEDALSERIEQAIEEVKRELVLAASPGELWEAIIGSGFLADEVHLDLRPGGEASFRTGEEVRTGWVEEVSVPAHGEGGRLVFWWSVDGEPTSRVELTLEPEVDARTRVRVVEARPLEVLDVIGVPLGAPGGSMRGPAMLAGAV